MAKSKIPSKLPITAFTVAVDTREQLPYDLVVNTEDGPVTLASVRKGLPTGDYSVVGFEDEIAVERKSLQDLIGCIGGGRDRFEAELKRLAAYPSRCVVVEASWAQLQMGGWRSQVTVNSAVGSVIGWIEQGIPFEFLGTRYEAGLYTARFLYIAARRRWRRLHEGFKSQLEVG